MDDREAAHLRELIGVKFSAVDQRFTDSDRAVSAALAAREKAVSAALTSADRAVRRAAQGSPPGGDGSSGS